MGMLLQRVFSGLTGSGLFLLLLISPISSAAVCNPTGTLSCGLPFPSDIWSVDDPNSPTGRRLQVPDDLFSPSALSELPENDGVLPSQVFEGASGYSAGSGVLFQFVAEPLFAETPVDGGDMVVAVDLTTGLRVPVRVKISPDAQAFRIPEVSYVLEVFPRSRWEYGHEILVVVMDELPLSRPETGLLSRLDARDGVNGGYSAGLLADLRQQGFNLRQVRNATRFTVRDRTEVTAPVFGVVEQMHADDHPVRSIEVRHHNKDPDIAAIVRGEVLIHNFRDRDGTGLVNFSTEPMAQWVPFRLVLPEAARSGSVPVAIYAHGLGFNRIADIPVKSLNAELGIATFGIDFPNHGSRIEADGGYVFGILTPEELAIPLGLVVQSTIDFASVHRAVLTSLADLDVLGPERERLRGDNLPDGIPDLDTTRILMEGSSLGGVLGAIYGAIGPELKGAVYTVTGVGLTHILSESVLWDAMFKRVTPRSASGVERVLLRTMMQQVMDFGDPINFIDYYRYPEPGHDARPLMLTMGEDDALVGNQATHAAALLLDMPVVGEILVVMDDVRYEEDFDPDGYGIRQYLPLYDKVPERWDARWLQLISDSSAHFSLLRPGDFDDQQEFIRRFVLPASD